MKNNSDNKLISSFTTTKKKVWLAPEVEVISSTKVESGTYNIDNEGASGFIVKNGIPYGPYQFS